MEQKILDCRDYQATFIQNMNELNRNKKISAAIIQIGDRPDSNKYVAQKLKHAEAAGISVRLYKFNEDIPELLLIETIRMLNERRVPTIIQQPIPAHLDNDKLINLIDADLDIDCLTRVNIGRLYSGKPKFLPCTPSAIVSLLKRTTTIEGKNILVIGRSHIVGKPLAELLIQENATVTVAHSKSVMPDLMGDHGYDIIISAVGKAKAFKAKADILIDVGINFDGNGKMCGDFDLDNCEFNYATPVPNGVGRLTICAFIENIMKAYK